MDIQPMEQCQQFCTAMSAFTRDMEQLTMRMWKEIGRQQFDFVRLCQECGEHQGRALGSGNWSDWNALAAEQSRIITEYSRKWLDSSQELFGLVTNGAEGMRASLGRFEPVWTLFPWQGPKEALEEGRDLSTAFPAMAKSKKGAA